MRHLLSLLLVITVAAKAQNYRQYDTIADPAVALQQLYAASAKNPASAAIYCQIAERKIQVFEWDSCIYYCNKAIELLTKSPERKLLTKALHAKGIAQYYLDDKFKAEENWRQGLQLAIQENEYERITKLASNLGAVYLDDVYRERKNIQNFKIADSFFAIAFHQLQLKDSLGSQQGLKTLRLMATSLQFQKKYDSADRYYVKVINLSRGKNEVAYLGALSFYAESLSETG